MLRFDHVGLTVSDLDRATAFFVGLGFEVEGRTTLEGAFLDAVTGLSGARTELVVLAAPGEGCRLELTRFLRPDAEPGSPDALSTRLGLSNVTFEVTDLPAVIDRLAADGYPLVGGVGEHEGSWRMACVRGPEGVLVNLAERLSST